MKQPRDAYKVLQVDPEADLEVIRAAYRRLAQKYHPDLASAGAEADAAALRMVEINAAWDQIRDPVRRSAYDRRRAAAAAAAATERPPEGGRPTPQSAPRPGAQTGSTPAGPRPAARPAPQQPRPAPWSGSPAWPTVPDGQGSAGPPPGRPSGSVLNFGRYDGWSLGEIGRSDPGYLEWLDRMPIGRPYRAELDVLLRKLGRRLAERDEATERRGLFRRR